MSNKSLLKFFSTTQNDYVYDAPTGRILICDHLTKDILKLYANGKEKDTIKELSSYPKTNVIERVKEIEELRQKEGVFRPAVPFRFQDKIDFGPSSKIRSVVLEVTNSCNLKCDYCVFSDCYPAFRKYAPASMSVSTALRAIDTMVDLLQNEEYDLVYIVFYGGEPLLEFDLIRKVVVLVTEKYPDIRFAFSMTTNGTIMNEEILEILTKYSIDLNVSIDGPEYIHNLYRRSNDKNIGSFDMVMRNLAMIREYSKEYYEKYVITINCVLSLPLCLDERASFFGDNSVLPTDYKLRVSPQIQTEMCDDKKKFKHAELELDKAWEEYKSEFVSQAFLKKLQRNGKSKFFNALFLGGLKTIINRPVYDGPVYVIGRTSCLKHWMKLLSDPKGDLYLCIPSAYFCDKRFRIGTINDGIDNKIIDNITNSWQQHRKSKCSDCWMAQLCLLCWPVLPVDEGEREMYCESARSNTEKWMVRVAELCEICPDIINLFSTPNDIQSSDAVTDC